MRKWIKNVVSAFAMVAAAAPSAAAEPAATRDQSERPGSARNALTETSSRRDAVPAGQIPLAGTRRARPVVQRPPAAIVTAAQTAAEAAVKAGAPAVQIAVSHQGRIVYSSAFGMADKENTTIATPRSVMQIASITKPFVAALILRLAERGALSIDDPVEKHLPEFKPRATPITLRHLLTHTSGLNTPLPPLYSPYTREQYMKALNAAPLEFTPGTKWVYSNGAYKGLGFVIESLTGKTLAEAIHTELALPLGLLDTGVCGTSGLPVPDGYSPQGTRIAAVNMSVAYAAGAMCSTAADLTRWSYLLANGHVMQPASYAAMTTSGKLTNNTLTNYGLGVSVAKMLGQDAVSHTGATLGFQSSLIYFSDKQIGVAVIVNTSPPPPGADPHQIALTVANAALGSL